MERFFMMFSRVYILATRVGENSLLEWMKDIVLISNWSWDAVMQAPLYILAQLIGSTLAWHA